MNTIVGISPDIPGKTRKKVPESAAAGLVDLVREEASDSAVFLQLSRILTGEPGRLLRELHRQEQSHGACLAGICALVTGARPRTEPEPVQMAPVEDMLRRCYGRLMRRLCQYERRSGDPEYGSVFRRLAQQEREHCRDILTVLSTMKRPA